MSKQSFDIFHRRAIWEAHQKKCAYCQEPLRYRDLIVDHVIPERFLNNKPGYQKVKEEYGLPEDLDIRSLDNLSSCCTACNSTKSDNLLPAGQTAIILAKTKKLRPRIENLIQEYRGEDKTDRLMLKLATAIENGKIDERKIRSLLSSKATNISALKFSDPFSLIGTTPVLDVSRDQIDSLKSETIEFAEGMPRKLRLVNDADAERFVDTLIDYEGAIREGFYSFSNAEMQTAAAYFERPISVLNAVKKATVAEENYIDHPRIGLVDINLLPADLLFGDYDLLSPDEGEEYENAISGKMISDLVSSGEAHIESSGSNHIRIETDGFITFMFEILRADISGGGFQEILIHWGGGVMQGTLRVADVRVLSRTKNDQPMSVVQVPISLHD